MKQILIADDDRSSRMILGRWLTLWGYAVVEASQGPQALAILAADEGPRQAILDWNMPGMDGPEVCRNLHDRLNHRLIHTILLTSRSDQDDLSEGLASGAHDFLTKPFDPCELKSRLDVGDRLLRYEDALAEKSHQVEIYAQSMEKLAEERARQLLIADRMACVGTLTAGVAHEINNPTSFISGNLQMIEEFWPVVRDQLSQNLDDPAASADRLHFILTEMPGILHGIHDGVKRITSIVQGLKHYSHPGTDEIAPARLSDCVQSALRIVAGKLNPIRMILKLDETLEPIPISAQQIEQVVINLLVNAADAMENTAGPSIEITTERAAGWQRLRIVDNGPGIPPQALPRLFDPFFTTKPRGKGTGLGLAICQKIIQDHRGRLTARNADSGHGAQFTMELPTSGREKQA